MFRTKSTMIVAAVVALTLGATGCREGRGKRMSENVFVVIETSMGAMKVELWADKAPNTVKNFLSYVDEGFFDGLIFHRVIPGFMIQGGGFNSTMVQKSTKAPVKNEASPNAMNTRGTLAMARTNDPHSATAQFFVNLVSNDFLNFRDESVRGWGYCVFGKVVEGMDVVDEIARVKTGQHGPHGDVPTTPVTITSIRRAD